LLLNLQLAIASHHSEVPAAAVSVTSSVALSATSISMVSAHSQHGQMQHEQHETVLHQEQQVAADNESLVQDVLCDKHCHPDSVQLPSQTLHLDAVPTETSILLIADVTPVAISSAEWLSPPVIGPPPEIEYCRFRE
jgi:hypothetical protein